MVAFFRYSPIDILSVHLPPLVLEFGHVQEEWIRKESREVPLRYYSDICFKFINMMLDDVVCMLFILFFLLLDFKF